MTTIADRLSIAQHRIAQAAQNAARNPSEIKLLAVSKTKPAADVITAYLAGQRCFGENYVQEGEAKVDELAPAFPDIEWHFIGPLQSNKSRIVAQKFAWLHTLDRIKLAKRLSEQRPVAMAPLNVLIQVNISQEDSKSGVKPEDVATLAAEVSALPGLCLRGLMAIPSPISETHGSDRLEQELATMKMLFDALRETYASVDTLSMGMSDDLELAITHGSTLVRIGTAIFGARSYTP
ncbi:YggS family pyridoxal phosphate-dependent enzyme [Shewanella cyperi]|uniref:YggS family pyridoxal phosphate-dependent enzyme n=1 Tax=Shewanella cyperi TaxID=2814292 RepID=UPI001A94B808|nr:YggS family pyridoxal phosphate-dependent enzyme [Shewanella cyperi]QSX41742.1 YggS family pyridoxal phosphate-dependent enzyme [Shewanella cyperi]